MQDALAERPGSIVGPLALRVELAYTLAVRDGIDEMARTRPTAPGELAGEITDQLRQA